MRKSWLGIPILIMDLGLGMVFVVLLMLMAAPREPVHPEPAEAQIRRLRAENADMNARLLLQSGGKTDASAPLPSSQAAERTGLALLQSEVAELKARNASLERQGQPGGIPPTATLDGREARIDRLQREIARLNTRIEESDQEVAEARRARMEAEARLSERETRLTQLQMDKDALASRSGQSGTIPGAVPGAPPADGRQYIQQVEQEELRGLLTRLHRDLEQLTREKGGQSGPKAPGSLDDLMKNLERPPTSAPAPAHSPQSRAPDQEAPRPRMTRP
ncbi:MAG: hypothetical protein HQL95_12735 [Magnetococcales bacterium]|nr:hypothetical protein [Magnetococcales bacterium]